MKIQDIMHKGVTSVGPETPVSQVAMKVSSATCSSPIGAGAAASSTLVRSSGWWSGRSAGRRTSTCRSGR